MSIIDSSIITNCKADTSAFEVSASLAREAPIARLRIPRTGKGQMGTVVEYLYFERRLYNGKEQH